MGEKRHALIIATNQYEDEDFRWTSDMYGASRAWVIYFSFGGCNISGFYDDLYVRAVR